MNTLVRNSGCYRLWMALVAIYHGSVLCKLFVFLGDCLENGLENSAIVRYFLKKGCLPKAFEHSLVCRLGSAVIHLPSTLLQWWYMAWKPLFEGSLSARFVYFLGDNTTFFAGLVMGGVLAIPYDSWNNSYSFVGFALTMLLLIAGSMKCRDLRLGLTDYGPYLTLFALAVTAAVPLSLIPSQSARFLLYHGTCLLCVLTVVTASRKGRDLLFLVGGASLGLAVAVASGTMQWIQGVAVNTAYVDLSLNAGMPGRIYSFFENPNSYATVLILLLPLVLGWLFCAKSWRGRVFSLVLLIFGMINLGATYSRSAWVGFAVAMVVFMILARPRWIVAFFVVALLCVPFLPDAILNRILTITNMEDASTSSRFPIYEAAWRAISQHPITGIGLGTEAVQSYVNANQLYRGGHYFVHAHNVFLQIWAEMGLTGLLAFCGAALWAVKETAVAVQASSHPQGRWLAIGGASALVGVLVCGLADYIWSYPRVMCLFWFVFGVTLAAVKVCKNQANQGEID